MEIRALVRRLHCSSPDGASSLVGLLPNDESRGFSHHRCTLVPVNLSLAVDGQATPSTLSLLFYCSRSSDLNVQTLAFRHWEVRQQINWVLLLFTYTTPESTTTQA
ncbi:unnamed protein product [Brassica napus]|uniref:(rape) hypothetical protein n=1 Tax=Brassica napus TaxID=3708 RepID=A0A816R3T8_BRANA|nr:unnamed protein product [Brassica napus]